VIELTNNTLLIFFRETFFSRLKRKKRKRKNIVGAPPCMERLHTSHHHGGGGETHRKLSWNVVFGYWETLRALPKEYGCFPHANACNACANNFSLFFFNLIYTNTKYPRSHTILTKRNITKNPKKTPQSKL
jgi:hypothetical protein